MSFINDAKSKLKQNLIDLLAISGIPHKISSETLAVIQCPKCSNFSAHLSLYNGWLYCSNCKCVINYRALAKQLGFEMKTRKNQGDFGMFSEHLGVFGKFKNPSQLEIERFVFESHSRLMNDEEMLQIVCERTNLHKESVKAYKIGLITGAGQCPFFICQNRDIDIPILSLDGRYWLPRFYSENDFKNKSFLKPKGVGLSEIFWGRIDKRRTPLFIVDTPIDAMILSQELLFARLQGNVISPSSPGVIPKELLFTKFYGFGNVRIITSDEQLSNRIALKLTKAVKRKVKIFLLHNVNSLSNALFWKKQKIWEVIFTEKNELINAFDFKEL